MGIDHYNCVSCGDIFPDVKDHRVCESCESRWCELCTQSYEPFYYDGFQVCSECFPSDQEIVPADLLKFLIERHGFDKQRLIEQYKAVNDIEEPQLKCTVAEEHECVGTECKSLEECHYCADVACMKRHCEVDDDPNGIPVLGLCCKERHPKHKRAWCDACKGERKKAKISE